MLTLTIIIVVQTRDVSIHTQAIHLTRQRQCLKPLPHVTICGSCVAITTLYQLEYSLLKGKTKKMRGKPIVALCGRYF
jgi:hypothetical protein